MRSRKPDLTVGQKWLLAALFLVPAALAAGKTAGFPGSGFLRQGLSFASISPEMADRIQYLLLVPLGALTVVFFRLTLGIPLFGPFRSILIAMAFQMTGIVPGLIFLTAIIAVIVALRPAIRALRMPYYGRISVLLSSVCLLIVMALSICQWTGSRLLESAAYFPIVVICLMADRFALTLAKQGFGAALWRGGMTALAAALIAFLSSVRPIVSLFIQYPEALLATIGAIIAISRYGDWRLADDLRSGAWLRGRARISGAPKAPPAPQE